MSISVIGAGNMGRALAKRFALAGETVLIAASDLASAQQAAAQVGAELSGTVQAVPTEEAITRGDIVVLATWYPVSRELAGRYGAVLDGKVVIDISNPFNDSYDGLTTDAGTSAAEEIAAAAPGARLVKAFNTTFAGVLQEGRIANEAVDVLLAGDDETAKAAVADIARRAGLNVVDAGALSNARTLERMSLLLVELQGRYGLQFQAGFRFVSAAAA